MTSNGISNPEITNALFDLAGHSASDLSIAFIPTSTNIEDEDKTWLIDNLTQMRDLHFAKLDIVDIGAVAKEIWQARIAKSDILVFGGGDTAYLVNLMHEIGFDLQLSSWLDTKLLIGISAGSVMCGPIINPRGDAGLGFVDFLIVPHKDAPYAKRTSDEIQGYANQMKKQTYWIDDESAIKIDGDEVEVIGSGKHKIFE